MNEATKNFQYGQEYFDYLNSRGKIRTLLRKPYLFDIRKYCVGNTIDFGCGTGSLLRLLPEGSIGFDINEIAVRNCQLQGLKVEFYDPQIDGYEFKMISPGDYSSFTMNHVLEHLQDPQTIIKKIFSSCFRLDIDRIVFTVPGSKCFKMDRSHRTFVTKEYFRDNNLLDNQYYKLTRSKYFPFNRKGIDRYFTHNELRLVFDKKMP